MEFKYTFHAHPNSTFQGHDYASFEGS